MRHEALRAGMILEMQRVRLAWLVAISLMPAGSLAAHSLAYRLVEPAEQARTDLLAGTGHGYLAAIPALLAACGAIGIAALAGLVVRGARGLAYAAPRWQLAVLPFLGFALQEHLERLLVDDPLLGAALEPTFLVGLSLQIPFAVAALLAVRVLSRAATSVGLALREMSPHRFPAVTATTLRPGDVLAPRLPPLALGSCGRGPPLDSRP